MTRRAATASGLLVSFVAALFVGLAGEVWWPKGFSAMLAKSVGGGLYSALLSASATLLGFMLTNLSIVASLSSVTVMDHLRARGMMRGVQQAFFRPTGPLALLTVLSLTGLFAGSCQWILYFTVFLVCATIVPMVYAMVVLANVLELVGKPDDEKVPTLMHETQRDLDGD